MQGLFNWVTIALVVALIFLGISADKTHKRVELLEDEVSTLQGAKEGGDVGVTSYGRRRGVIKGVPTE